MNQTYIDLLNDINIDTSDLTPIPHKSYDINYNQQIPDEIYEYWDWGSHVLQNLNEPGCEHPFAIEYNDEKNIFWRKIHRYSRKERFKFTLYQLLGVSGDVPLNVVSLVKHKVGRYSTKKKLWNTIRQILKESNNRRYYNRIPTIIQMISSKLKPIGITQSPDVLKLILQRFNEMDSKFNKILKKKWDRSYFLNLRYVALRLIDEFKISFPYKIPIIRTLRKKQYLNNLYDDF